MRNNSSKSRLIAAGLAASVLFFSGATFAQTVNLTARPTSTTLPDGTTVPMWGLFCNDAGTGASCATLKVPSTAIPAAWVANTKYVVGQAILDGNNNVQVVSIAGTSGVGPSAPSFGTTPGAMTSGDGTVTWTDFGTLAQYQAGFSATWAPPIITVATNSTLTINLTNNLSFANSNPVPTSLTIVGQLGGGLGDVTQRTTAASPDHSSMQANVTWPIAGAAGNPGTPPPQAARVQSFSTEVAAAATGSLTWNKLRPGTYLIESGTHPSIQGPMGLYGMLVVTTAPTSSSPQGTAYPGVNYNAEIPLLLSEIDPAQNAAVQAAVGTAGFSETAVLGPNYNEPVAAITVTNPGQGYTTAPSVMINPVAGDPGTGATAHAVIDSDSTSPTYGQVTEIDLDTPGQNYVSAPTVTLMGGGFSVSATARATLAMRANAIVNCSGGAAACYPPAVNYTPLYYLFNGVAFDKTLSTNSVFPTAPAGSTATPVTGNVLVRLVNAGLRMHVPSIVGSSTGSAAAPGFGLIAEDGNPLPGVIRVQSEVFMAAGKTYDVMMNAPTSTTAPALPIYDRELSLSANSVARDAGMLAYISVNGATMAATGAVGTASAVDDFYPILTNCAATPCQSYTVSDYSKGVIANDHFVSGVTLLAAPTSGTVNLNANGTFSYTPNATGRTPDTFTYCANGTVTGSTCSSGVTATVHINNATLEASSGITLSNNTFTSNLSTSISIKPPGVLTGALDAAGYQLSVTNPNAPITMSVTGTPLPGATAVVDANGGFNATAPGPGTYTFTVAAHNSQGVAANNSATVTVVLQAAAPGLTVTVLDGTDKQTQITDYRWVIEEDRTFYVDPKCTTNPPPAGCPTAASGIVPTFGTNFHTSYMPVIATGCTGDLSCEKGQSINGSAVVCDIGNGVCHSGTEMTPTDPSAVHLDLTKRYYISILPGDAGNDFAAGYTGDGCAKGIAGAAAGFDTSQCGHGMGGAPIMASCTPVPPATTCTPTSFGTITIYTQPAPYPPAKLSVFVFEDDFPLNGEQDAGGGIDVLAQNEPGLGQFNITLFDDAGGTGDATGQMTYDMFNQPLVNSLAGTIDPATQQDACPISKNPRPDPTADPTATGITGTIVTCPRFEADGTTLSPLAGQAVIANLMPGRYGVVATPGADRIARGEEWLQTNTLDGQKAHDSFLRIGEPSFFQEFGPAGYHVSIGFANPAIINGRKAAVCGGTDPNITGTNCTNSITGQVTTVRMSRTPDERLYSSGTIDSFAFTQCYVSFGDPDGEDFAFTKCNGDGTFTLSGLPDGTWRVTVFDQWNDMLVDGLSTPVALSGGATVNMHDIAMNQWQANIITSTFFDQNGDGVRQDGEPGLTLVPTNIRFRDGSYSNFNNTDLSGNAGFNEVFPLFSWYVIETDSIRYKNTGTHVVYDAGGPADGSTDCTNAAGNPVCGASAIGQNMANTAEQVSVPVNLRVPGARYCASADCPSGDLGFTGGTPGSTGRVDPPWVMSEGWQGFSGQNSFLEFGKKPFAEGETGGIHGEVIYASTRPFDDPSLLLHTSWTPDVPNVLINLYAEATAADGSTTLKLIDHTMTTSWDAWAQGFRSDGVPNMNCPGQGRDTGTNADLFFFTLANQPQWLDFYNSQHGGPAPTTLPANSQFKCFDGMHNWNQLQPAPYDGAYYFPSVTGIDPATGRPTTNCTGCVANTDTTDPYWSKMPMLPPGKYVVEMVVPAGYELVKEEDKNILIGDNYIAPVTVEFPNLATAVYIMPDQAEVSAYYNVYNAQNPTTTLGRTTYPSQEGDTGSVETFWPCVGAVRQVPDYISLFPQSQEVAPFAGAFRPLCDRKEVTLTEQTSALAKFWVFTSAHVAAHFTGVITDDFTSEFDPFSPQFGEKFSPPNMPISIKDWTGSEISRVYSDQWGTYDGLTYSTWEVNPPNPTGYGPTMMVTCMNDPGTGPVPDPLFNPAYSQFCYEIPFMPGQTQYMDTPVVPTSAMVGAGYNNPDCAYPTATPAIAEVDGDAVGPWVSATGHTLTITALGDQSVGNYGYSGPQANGTCTSGPCPDNQKTVTRHYGFGTRCTSLSTSCTSISSAVLIGPVAGGAGSATVPLNITNWTDTTITATVPTSIGTNVHFPCPVQQQAQYRDRGVTTPYSSARCGQLVITAGNGRQSVDTVTVTVGGRPPTHVTASGSIQAAIDAAAPGDLIIVDRSVHRELVLMWKPVRLQGVGAASSIIDASTHPAGTLKLNPWRASVNCLFGLALNGQPSTGTSGSNVFDPTGTTYKCPTPSSPTASGTGPDGNTWNYFYGGPNFPTMVVDRVPLEGILGWDATVNGNLAEQLQEPSLMGAYEGAGITVISKGLNIPAGAADPFGSGAEAAFPAGTTLLTGTAATTVTAATGAYTQGTGDSNPICKSGTGGTNQFPSNFMCNPSSIDALGITDASQGGGGIFVHGWGHNLQIANNRVYNNAGTLSGGISLGQGESPEAYLAPNSTVVTATPPGSCADSSVTNVQLPYCQQLNVNVHNNMVVDNSSTGDELFSGTPAGAGGVSICTGSDYYKFNYNWVCGNLSTGDGGGVGHLGFSWNGDIEHNAFLFNQATNPTIQANGGGLIVMGAAPDATLTGGVECGSVTDNDCVPGLSDGIGPGLVINANLFEGNSADSGSGGGLRLQAVNGTDIARFTNPGTCTQQYTGTGAFNCRWYLVSVTNNIINNNVAGWDGAGISLEDALAVKIINNTISSNDTTASSGVLFNTLGAPLASSQSPAPTCQSQNSGTASCPQPAGLVSLQNSPQLTSSFTTGNITCPAGHYAPGTNATNGTCTNVSYPALYNNIFWQNRAFQVGVGGFGMGNLTQQHVVTLYNAAIGGTTGTIGTIGSLAASQLTTGACPTGASYWDIGVRNDRGPADHGSGYTLNPLNGVLTSGSGYSGTNSTTAPGLLAQYCNGSRVPPEATCKDAAGQTVPCGWQVPPGIADATVPNPVFNLTPAATVDEGNNWINISWGPLSMLNPVTSSSTTNVVLGNYALATGAPAIDAITCSSTAGGVCTITLSPASSGVTTYTAPAFDFFGNARPDAGSAIDVGAVESPSPAPAQLSISPSSGVRGTTVNVTLTGTNLDGATAVTINCTLTGCTNGVTHGAFTVNSTGTTITTTFTITRGATLGARNVTVTTPGGTTTPVTFTVTGATITFTDPGLNTGGTGTKNGTITVSNTATGATAGSFTFTAAPTITKTAGPASGTFSITGGTCVNGFTINAGSNCTINVRYVTGGSTANSTAHVTITGNGLATASQNSPNFTAN